APPVVIYTTANAVALLLMPLIAVASAIVLHDARTPMRLAAAVFLAVALPATLASFSRGGYLALAAVALLLALTSAYRLWLVPAIVVAGALVSRLPPIAQRLGHEVDVQD